MHDHERDIIDQIDEITEPGPDAMRWIPQNSEDSPDTFNAVLLGMDRGGLISLTPSTAEDKVTELVGDPHVTHLEPVTGVAFWLPSDARTISSPNIVATHLLGHLLRDVADGDLATSDDNREFARMVLADLPVLFGPCLITGVTQNGDGPGPLSDRFWDWFHRYADQTIKEVTARHIAALLHRHCIPPEAITRIVIVEN